MAKIDKHKERLTMLRFWLGIVVATLLAIIGWSITNFSKLETWLLLLSLLSIVFLVLVVIWLSIYIDKKIDELEDL